MTQYTEERSAKKQGLLGAEAVMSQEVFQARFTQRSAVPLCHTTVVKLRREFREAYWVFWGQFKEASTHLREHVAQTCCTPHVSFPEGGVPLSGGG